MNIKEQIEEILLTDYQYVDCYTVQKLLDLFVVMQRSEQLIGFLKDYQKSCEIMHVSKIDAKNFVEHWKTN